MYNAPKTEVEGAQGILKRYYKELVRDIAEDIIQHKEHFEGGTFTGADELLEKHAHRLCQLREVYWSLARITGSKKPVGTEALAKDEFRCFGCGGLVRTADERCRLCGWTWQ